MTIPSEFILLYPVFLELENVHLKKYTTVLAGLAQLAWGLQGSRLILVKGTCLA